MRTALLALYLVAAFGAPASAADLAGTILRLQGAASAVVGETARLLRTGDDLYVGETITTGRNTRLRMRLIEGAVITLGDHSTFTLQGYEAESDGPVLDLIQGVLLGVSAEIAERRKRGLTVRTPVGTAGTRGTTFWVRQDLDGLQVALIEGGGVFVEAAGKRVILDILRGGVSVKRGQAPSQPKRWGDERIERSLRQVTFD